MKKKAMPAAQARTGAGKPARKARGKAAGRTKGVKEESGGRRAMGQKLEVRREKSEVKAAGKSARMTKVTGPEVALEDGQQERFCQLMALGAYSNYSCYAQAYEGCTLETARANSSRLLTKANIRARIAWIREDALKSVKIRIEESLRWYQTVRDTPVGYVDEESPLAQEVQKEIEGTEETGPILKVKVKIPSKMDAQRQIDKLMGFEKPQEVQVTMAYEPPSKALERLSGRGIDVAAILAKAGVLRGNSKR